jgi:hypothetical protein
MPKADATGLAPKKSAAETLQHNHLCWRVFGFTLNRSQWLHFFGEVSERGLGLKNAKTPGRFCRAHRIRFCLPGYPRFAYTGEYPIPANSSSRSISRPLSRYEVQN